MDLATWDDPKVCRGIEILQDKVTDHTKINALEPQSDEGDEDGAAEKKKKEKNGKEVKDAKTRRGTAGKASSDPSGLDLGRRLLVVLKTPAAPGDKPCPWCKAKGSRPKALRVVDHGTTQKEAVRRLFDAQVLLRSYEEQLQDKERENRELHFALKEKKTNQQQLRNQAEEGTMQALKDGKTTEELQAENEKNDAKAKKAAADGADDDLPVVPYWLRNDQRSREAIEKFKLILNREVQQKGEMLDAATIGENLWQVGYAFALRWAGGPDDELIKQNKKLADKFKTIQKQSLQESNMLRQHIRKLEIRYRELQKNARQMKTALKHATDAASQARAAAFQNQQGRNQQGWGWQQSSPGRPLHPGAAAIVAGWMQKGSDEAGGGDDTADSAGDGVDGGGGGGGGGGSGCGLGAAGGGFPGGGVGGGFGGGFPGGGGGGPMGGGGAGFPGGGGGGGFGGGFPGGGGGGGYGGGFPGGGGGGGYGPGPGGPMGGGGGGFPGGGGGGGFGPGSGGPMGGGGGGFPGGGGGGGFGGGFLGGGGGGGYGPGLGGPMSGGSGGFPGGGGGGGFGPGLGGPMGGGGRASGGYSMGPGSPNGGGGGGFGLGSPTGGPTGGFGSPSFARSAAMNFDYNQELPLPPSNADALAFQPGDAFPSLAEDSGATEEELEQMDHEIFEPLNSFDDDIREMLIDAVNAKVRRILSLDPSKFQNGKLPFGLRPDGTTASEEELLNQIRKLNARVAEAEEERDNFKKEAEELRRMIDAMRQRKGLPAAGEPGDPWVPESPTETRASSPVGRGPAPEKEEVREAPPAGPMGISEQEVQRRIKEVKEELMQQIRMLEQQLKQKTKEVEDLRRRLMEAQKGKPERKKADEPEPEEFDDGSDEIARLKSQLRDLRSRLDKSEGNEQDLMDRIKELERLLDEANSRPPVEVPGKPPPPKPVEPQGDSLAAKKTQELLHKLLQKAARELGVEATAKGQKAAEGVLGTSPGEGKKAKKDGLIDKALGGLEVWTAEVLTAMEGLKDRLAAKLKVPEPVVIKEVVTKEAPPPPPPKEESPREGKCYKKEHKDLEKRLKEMQDEISRLLLTIDELRRRIEQLQNVPMDPDEEDVVNSIMDKVGLKDLAEAAGNGPKLKGVFERLYQDSIQRIQRYGMVRERMMLANKAYSAAVSAAVSSGGDGGRGGPDAIPDFERLNETTQATLRGMWYHTERIFKNCCEYAMTQGVEASLLRAQMQRDLPEGLELDTGLGIDDEIPPRAAQMRRPRGNDRLPGRRGERPRAPGHAPPADRRGPDVNDSVPRDFKSYVAALREARDSDQLLSPERRKPPSSHASNSDDLRTLKAACAPGSAGSQGLGSSRSLPALPKGRGLLQGDGSGTPLSRTPISAALQM